MPELSYTGRVACIGEAMVELMLGSADSEDARFAFAGDTLNTAIYLKRLLPSAAQVSYISVLGQDPLSRRMVDFIRSEGIDTQHIGRSKDRSIGLYAIETDDSGERTFSYWRGQSAARTLFQQADELDFSALANFDSLCLSAITLAILPAHVRHALLAELARLRADNNVTVIFDSNYRPALWESVEIAREVVAAAWRITDIALPSIDDEQALFADADQPTTLSRLQGYGINNGALKRGAQGPLALGNDFEESKPELRAELWAELWDASHVKIIDTTAAGDSFNAGYLASRLSGTTEQDAMLAGHHCSLRVIAHAGAIIPLDQW